MSKYSKELSKLHKLKRLFKTSLVPLSRAMPICKTSYFVGNAETIISGGNEVTPQGGHIKDCLGLLLKSCSAKGISRARADEETENNEGLQNNLRTK